ncbi:hypothetical protein [Rhodanobacter sp. B04]|uniref:hypothetical protein n=1 Tax=Rhodanobacter sp. B04 TaxID=1945860 RepID=UPI001115A376|nr:hypothetical protein [Rhodanobacter sp. B04]
MSRTRTRLIGWTYDDARQEIRIPSGHVIPLIEIAQRIQNDLACCYNFGGAWSGWRMRGRFLYAPGMKRGGGALSPQNWQRFVAFCDELDREELREVRLPAQRIPLRLVR